MAEPELAVDTPRQNAKHLTLFCDFAAGAESALDEDADGADTITAFLFSVMYLTCCFSKLSCHRF